MDSSNFDESVSLSLQNLKQQCAVQEKRHIKTAHYFSFLYCLIGLPALIIPFTMSTLNTSILEDYEYATEVNSIFYIVTGVFNTSLMFFQLEKKKHEHYRYANIYKDLSTDIDLELNKSKKHEADEVLLRMTLKFDHINNTAPEITPKSCCCLICHNCVMDNTDAK